MQTTTFLKTQKLSTFETLNRQFIRVESGGLSNSHRLQTSPKAECILSRAAAAGGGKVIHRRFVSTSAEQPFQSLMPETLVLIHLIQIVRSSQIHIGFKPNLIKGCFPDNSLKVDLMNGRLRKF